MFCKTKRYRRTLNGKDFKLLKKQWIIWTTEPNETEKVILPWISMIIIITLLLTIYMRILKSIESLSNGIMVLFCVNLLIEITCMEFTTTNCDWDHTGEIP